MCCLLTPNYAYNELVAVITLTRGPLGPAGPGTPINPGGPCGRGDLTVSSCRYPPLDLHEANRPHINKEFVGRRWGEILQLSSTKTEVKKNQPSTKHITKQLQQKL